QGFHSPEALPRALNPPAGFIATANQDLNFLGKAHPINVCMAAYRADRISSALGAHDSDRASSAGTTNPHERSRALHKFTFDQMRRLQLDLFSPQAERFMGIMAPLLG